MKRALTLIFGGGALLVSSMASAIPFTTGIQLQDATMGTGLCVNGCAGTITFDLGVAGGIAAQADGFYDVIDIDVTIDETVGGVPELTFGTLSVGGNFLQITGGQIGQFFASTSTVNNHTLSINNSDWTILPISPFAGGTLYTGGGSGAQIPEPGSIALFGMGLLAFRVAAKRRRRA